MLTWGCHHYIRHHNKQVHHCGRDYMEFCWDIGIGETSVSVWNNKSTTVSKLVEAMTTSLSSIVVTATAGTSLQSAAWFKLRSAAGTAYVECYWSCSALGGCFLVLAFISFLIKNEVVSHSLRGCCRNSLMFETKRLTRDRLELGSVVDNFGYLLLTLFFFYFGFWKCSAICLVLFCVFMILFCFRLFSSFHRISF